ncbi:MAG: aminoglycoside phosphotransferase family protein [Rubrobacter sp.]|nr:aminoglycoside phosphotransferase family protein [Rubrobacter sp.]
MPFLERALDAGEVREALERVLLPEEDSLRVREARLVRHKPGRRALIEYYVELARAGGPPRSTTLLGKVRARGLDRRSYRVQGALGESGFGPESADGVSVPEVLGALPEMHLWLQRRVPGIPATDLLSRAGGEALACRIAEAAHKLHRAEVLPLRRPHGVADELYILRERLRLVGRERPDLSGRLEKVLDACDCLGDALPEPETCGVHRDFYPDQVLVDGDRIYLLDLDLYCEGDPALDIGNFLGHIEELSLRTLGDPYALSGPEAALEERFLELSGGMRRASVRAYTTLTLARHIQISTLFADRRPFTGALLELCEERLGISRGV